jgi:enediyne biosynthesis protein E4
MKTHAHRSWPLRRPGQLTPYWLTSLCVALLLTLPARGQNPPVIVEEPEDTVISLGGDASLKVRATATAPAWVEWYRADGDSNTLLLGTNNNARFGVTLTLTRAQAANAGEYFAVITNDWGTATSQIARVIIDPTFTKITTGPIAEDRFRVVWSLAWGDYDNDGYLDLMAPVDGGEAGASINALYRNQGDGTFVRVHTEPLATDRGWYIAAAWADFDNDGHLDLFVPDAARWYSGTNPRNHLLYRGLGGGEFTKILQDPAATGFPMGWDATWGDFNNDGYVDLFVVGAWTSRNWKNHLFRNTGSGGFTEGPVFNENPNSAFAVASDFDHDGDLDLLVSCWYTRLLYRNHGDGTFEQILTGPIPPDDGNSGGLAWGDYDNDGDIDLCLATYNQTLHLFNNDGSGNFTRTTLGPNANYQVPNWVDCDNDGWLDLFVTHGPGGAGEKRNRLFRNNGDGSFSEVRVGSPTSEGGYSSNSAWADYDNDGFPDLVVANGYQTDGSMFIYRNNGNANHWLNIRLVGTVSNRSAIGAKVRLLATIGGNTFWQLREISGGGSGNQADPRALFGLGDATEVEVLRIEWPSGIVQELSNLPANEFRTVTEPPRLMPLAPCGFQIQCWLNQSFDIQASTDLAAWTHVTTLTNETGTLEFHDPANSNHDCRYYRVMSR